jgi:hypothetical protein
MSTKTKPNSAALEEVLHVSNWQPGAQPPADTTLFQEAGKFYLAQRAGAIQKDGKERETLYRVHGRNQVKREKELRSEDLRPVSVREALLWAVEVENKADSFWGGYGDLMQAAAKAME